MTPSEIGKGYLGLKELPGNVWKNEGFGAELHKAGQKDGDPYCAFATEVWFKKAYPEKFDKLDKLFSASAVQTFKNFQSAGFPIGLLPFVDALVIWQQQKDGVAQWQGHAGVVCAVNAKDKELFESIEANTTDGTKENRDGGVVARKPHRVNRDVLNGLKVLGFVKI